MGENMQAMKVYVRDDDFERRPRPFAVGDALQLEDDLISAIYDADLMPRRVEQQTRRHVYGHREAAVLTLLFADPEVKELVLQKLPLIGRKMTDRIRGLVRTEAEELLAAAEKEVGGG